MSKIIIANQKFLEEQVKEFILESPSVAGHAFAEWMVDAFTGTMTNIYEDIKTYINRFSMAFDSNYQEAPVNKNIITKIEETFPLDVSDRTHY